MGGYVAKQILILAKNNKLNFTKLKIAVLGFAFNENNPDTRNTKIIQIINYLKKKNVKFDIFDPIVNKKDGGLISFNFDFTERTDLIEKLDKSKKVLKNWFLANSTHVVDLAFFLGGSPHTIKSYISKKYSWNKSPSIFCGSGKTKEGLLFSYHANWHSGGRWSIEIFTKRGKYFLCPLEKLFFQRRGSFKIKEIKLKTTLEKNFKPGIYLQTKSFTQGIKNNLLSLDDYNDEINFYKKIAGYH